MGRGAGVTAGSQAGAVGAARTAGLKSPTPRLPGTALPSGTADTDLCREPILASGVCRGSLASPPARSWSHFPERKSVCSDSGGTCSEEWRRRVRRCAWLNSGAPRPTRFGERGVARGRVVRTTRAPARRGSPPRRGRGMDPGACGVEGVTEQGCELVKSRQPAGLVGDVQRVATGPREAQREPWQREAPAWLPSFIRMVPAACGLFGSPLWHRQSF